MGALMKPMSPRHRLLVGCLLISFSSVFVGLSSVPSTVSAFYRVAIGGVVLAGLWLLRRARFSRAPTPWALLAAAAVFFALDLGFWHRAIDFVGPGLSTLLASLQVFFMAAAGRVLFGQRLTWAQLAAIPIALIGLTMLVGIDLDKLETGYGLGVVLGLLTALTYAGFMLCLRQAQAPGNQRLPIAELAIVSLASAVLLSGAAVQRGESLVVHEAIDWLWLGSLGTLCHVGGWLAIASSLPRVSTAVAGLTLTLQPMLTLVWDVLIFGRGLTLLEASGAVLTLVAVQLGSRRA